MVILFIVEGRETSCLALSILGCSGLTWGGLRESGRLAGQQGGPSQAQSEPAGLPPQDPTAALAADCGTPSPWIPRPKTKACFPS